MSVRMHLHQYMGADAAGGYALFFSPGTSTAKTTYQSDYSTAASLNAAGGVAISTDGWLDTYLLGDYDMTVYSRTGSQIANASADGINPQEAESETTLNLLVNGSFESTTGSLPSDWTLTSYSGSTNVLDSSDSGHGAKSMKFTSTGSGGGFIVSDQFMECSPSRAVFVSFLLKSTADVRNLVEVIWYTSGQVEISDTDIYDNSTTNPTSWAVRGGAAIPPSTAYYMKIRIYGCHSSDATAGTARFDDVVVAQQVLTPISGYVSSYFPQLLESGGNSTAFDIDANVTEGSFESVGPTGSSATNIWTAMDTRPAHARMAILWITLSVTNSSNAAPDCYIYARMTGDSSAQGEANTVLRLQCIITAAISNNTAVGGFALVPLDTSGRFDINWGVSNDTARGLNAYVRGFI